MGSMLSFSCRSLRRCGCGLPRAPTAIPVRWMISCGAWRRLLFWSVPTLPTPPRMLRRMQDTLSATHLPTCAIPSARERGHVRQGETSFFEGLCLGPIQGLYRSYTVDRPRLAVWVSCTIASRMNALHFVTGTSWPQPACPFPLLAHLPSSESTRTPQQPRA